MLASFDARGGVGDVVFASVPQEPTDELRRLRPELRTAFTAREMGQFLALRPENIDGYLPPSGFIQAPQEIVDASFLARARAFGLKVHAWTVNDGGDMCRLMQLGVDGLFTDDPERLETIESDAACVPS